MVCTLPSVGYIDVFVRQRKIASYAACFEHLVWAWAAEEIGQDWVRDALASVIHFPKGSIPRFKVRAG